MKPTLDSPANYYFLCSLCRQSVSKHSLIKNFKHFINQSMPQHHSCHRPVVSKSSSAIFQCILRVPFGPKREEDIQE